MKGGNYLKKDILALETPHIGYVIRETENIIKVLGYFAHIIIDILIVMTFYSGLA
jgi:hypothetical protein